VAETKSPLKGRRVGATRDRGSNQAKIRKELFPLRSPRLHMHPQSRSLGVRTCESSRSSSRSGRVSPCCCFCDRCFSLSADASSGLSRSPAMITRPMRDTTYTPHTQHERHGNVSHTTTHITLMTHPQHNATANHTTPCPSPSSLYHTNLPPAALHVTPGVRPRSRAAAAGATGPWPPRSAAPT
jgi:hypothetical protein